MHSSARHWCTCHRCTRHRCTRHRCIRHRCTRHRCTRHRCTRHRTCPTPALYPNLAGFFERVANIYQKERWWKVLSHIMRCLRTCAEQLRNLQQFVKCSVALLNNKCARRV